MTDKSTVVVEGNKTIARFTGRYKFDYLTITDLPPEKLKYHSDWNLLMPAVKKWNDLVISKRTEGKAGWMKWQYKTVMLRTEIEPVFKDLVAVIKWHNQYINQKA